jgi:hypothetical protein
MGGDALAQVPEDAGDEDTGCYFYGVAGATTAVLGRQLPLDPEDFGFSSRR